MTLFCVLGDAHLDVVVCPDGPAAEETDTPARTRVGAGGQAANVAAWIVALGGQARLIAARGTDLAADLVASDLRQRGVDLRGPVVRGPDRRGGLAVRGGVSRSMLTDRGVGPRLTAEALEAAWLAGAACSTSRRTAWPGRRSAGPRWPRPPACPGSALTFPQPPC